MGLMDRTPGYTTWNLLGFLLALVWQHPTVVSMSFCSCVGVVTSFHLGLLMDPTALDRLITKNDLPRGWRFHFYNSLAHVVPVFVLLAVVWMKQVPVLLHHGLWVSVVHIGWGILVSGGSLSLDHVYAYMPVSAWYGMWVTAVLSEAVLVPYFF
ncbi:hypothetical protein PTSG_06442 [Salpingoeca rosetta]|uniref:Uncharacterized protein n=1 Tax=Salpingoeca rosetta (strain ATCC 50818 / BSB-021) TaxID=946362 RepID=F2UFT7_SALR5|nr:uncharacterized protein PTSG_06442 [Salpingoeca rosetta]EGD75365.1 hypothetical protein PTSG_06442 [Salpingoeca rosetta]|eukprot:XP_004991822.1 hypothetical protein PTSG_06442 [Salpingoeca rosetta]